jgi:peptide/nickel transport system permease protein
VRPVQLIVGRLAAGVATLLAVSLVVFCATEVLPGDPARKLLPPQATEQQVARERARLGLDRPAPERYLDWLAGFVRGDLGRSYQGDRPVGELIGGAARDSLALAALVLAALVPLTLALGLLSGIRAGGVADHAVMTASLVFLAVPPFATAAMLVLVLAVGLGWLPAQSLLDPGRSPLAQLDALVLPALALLLASLAFAVRLIRAATIEALASEHVAAARLRGVPELRVLARHALPGVLPVAVQALALTAISLISGAVVVEVVVGYPGLGALLQSAVSVENVPVVQAIALLVAAVVVLANLLADLAVHLLVPRLRTAGSEA